MRPRASCRGSAAAPSSSAVLLIISIIGTTVAPWQLFFQQSNIVDKKITPRWLNYERVDTIIGSFIVVIGAAALIARRPPPDSSRHGGTNAYTNALGVARGLGQLRRPRRGSALRDPAAQRVGDRRGGGHAGELLRHRRPRRARHQGLNARFARPRASTARSPGCWSWRGRWRCSRRAARSHHPGGPGDVRADAAEHDDHRPAAVQRPRRRWDRGSTREWLNVVAVVIVTILVVLSVDHDDLDAVHVGQRRRAARMARGRRGASGLVVGLPIGLRRAGAAADLRHRPARLAHPATHPARAAADVARAAHPPARRRARTCSSPGRCSSCASSNSRPPSLS